MAWVYSRTTSILLIQLMHASSTGFLVSAQPGVCFPGVNEVFWYTLYAAALWVGIAMVAAIARRRTSAPFLLC